jgi:hypothetical protein
MVRAVIGRGRPHVPVTRRARDARQGAARGAGGGFVRAGQGEARGRLPMALEDEMCDFGIATGSSGRSPDRLDALVWAVTALAFAHEVPAFAGTSGYMVTSSCNFALPIPSAARTRPPNPKPPRTGALVALFSEGRARWTPRDYAALAREGYQKNAVAYRCVRTIAEAVAGSAAGAHGRRARTRRASAARSAGATPIRAKRARA